MYSYLVGKSSQNQGQDVVMTSLKKLKLWQEWFLPNQDESEHFFAGLLDKIAQPRLIYFDYNKFIIYINKKNKKKK